MLKKIIVALIISAIVSTAKAQSTCVGLVTPTTLSFPQSGGSKPVWIKGGLNCTWRITSQPLWVDIFRVPKSTRVNIYCEDNNSHSRTGTIVIDNFFTITITQPGIPVPVPSTPSVSPYCGYSVLKRGNPPTGVTWYWQGTSCGTSTANYNINYTVTNSGTYYLRARHMDGTWSNECSSIYVDVVKPFTLLVSASPSAEVQPGNRVQLTASGATSYQWQPGGSGSNVLNVTPTESTNYTVTGSNSQCSATASKFVTVIMVPGISQSQNSLKASVTGGAGPYTYLWSTGETTPSINVSNSGIYSVTIKDKYNQSKSASFNFVKKQDYNKNYVRTYVPAMDYQPTAAPDFNNLDYSLWKVATHYFDGFGRSTQSVATKASPSGKDVVVLSEYDDLGRQSKSYLGYTAEPNDMPGAFREKPLDEQNAFYQSNFGQGNFAFAKTEYDGSPMNLPEKQYQPGQDWDGKFTHMAFDGIGGYEVINWQINGNQLVNQGTYAANKLVRTEITDEDNRSATVYNDLQGRQILKKTVVDGQDVLNYFVYDNFGRLRYVLTPKALPLLTGASYTPNDDLIKALCYYYEYNGRHLLVKKQLPGAGYISMEYDNLDRLGTSQDAVQRAKGEKSFIEYDFLGRTAATGTQDNAGIKTYLGHSYYDSYNNLPAQYAFVAAHAFHAQSTKVKGMATWGKTRVMDWEPASDMPEWLITVTYYDDLGRPIQSVSNNHKGGIDISSTKYLYDGTVTETRTTHRVSEPVVKNDIIIKNKFEYDQRGYLLRQKEQINSEPEVIVNELEYWETGQVKKKKIHSADNGAHFVQTVDFQYNIKGWLTQINNPASLNGDLFAMKLDYTQGTNKEYNGNISAISWASATYTDIKKYNFNYDGLGRLSNADYSDGQGRDYDVGLTYDLNGNILTLNRKGRFADGNFGNIDNLTYSYQSGGQSNQLDRVDDVNATNNQAHGFTDLGAFAANEYNYDVNGNMLSDANRQITQVTYNSMNLPVEITFSGGSGTTLTNTYLAGGTKLRKEKEGGKTDYIGSFIYEDDELKYIQTGGGRIVVEGATYARQYYLTDHLGNIRLIFDTQGHVLQEDSYYPFGMAQEGLNYVNETLLDPEYKNKYLYNGKEQDDLTRFFEYGFRDYDSQLARWHCVDPSAESYIASSPYHFAGNNPISNREIDGANYSQEFYDVYAEYLQDTKQGWQGHGGVRDYTGQRPGTDGYTYNWATGGYQNTNGETVTWGEVSSSEWFNGIMSKAETFEWKDVSDRYNNTEGGFTYNEEDGTYHLNDAADKVMAWMPVDPPSVGMVGRQVMEPMKGFWDYLDYFLNGRYHDGYKVGADGKIMSNYRIESFDVNHNAASLLIGGGSKSIIKGTQLGLRDIQVAKNIMQAMLNGTYDYTAARGIISGFKDLKGVFYISEGHHRIAAAMEIFRTTGEIGPLNQLLKNGRWDIISGTPSRARPLPSLDTWGRFRNWLGF